MGRQRKTKQVRRVKAQDDILSPVPGFDSGLDFNEISEHGISGFTQAQTLIKKMLSEGFEDIDIIIQLHEELPQEVAQLALAECKKRGIL